jgi:hypothetical protein
MLWIRFLRTPDRCWRSLHRGRYVLFSMGMS